MIWILIPFICLLVAAVLILAGSKFRRLSADAIIAQIGPLSPHARASIDLIFDSDQTRIHFSYADLFRMLWNSYCLVRIAHQISAITKNKEAYRIASDVSRYHKELVVFVAGALFSLSLGKLFGIRVDGHNQAGYLYGEQIGHVMYLAEYWEPHLADSLGSSV